MDIAVFSDVICPWCFIGKRRLERALDELGWRDRVAVEWLPFELNPDMPVGGVERSIYRARKFGAERSAVLDEQIRSAGAEEGIGFAFERQARTPNTRRAHMLIAGVQAESKPGVVDRLVEALFRAYFEEGRDIGEDEVLAEIALSSGLSREMALTAIRNEELARTVLALEEQASGLGIAGVPYFILDRSIAVSGAQPTELWLDALREIEARANAAVG